MTHSKKATTARLLRGLTAAAALLLAVPAPALAAHRHIGPGDWLYVTVTHRNARTSDIHGTLLLCDPPRGHSHAAEACAQLRRAGGDIRGIPRKNVFCSMIYAPVTVDARGQWHGRAVRYTETFANACAMRARTGDVFALDG
ncbi:SSI family serine proteinase inhibitor [Streptomyces sp. NPDC020801]|uniref:SSI family serine proteinase inhibitor n=1 Tax=unclassified Streptomyces TaxID=2593676 RepID=UPI003798B77B